MNNTTRPKNPFTTFYSVSNTSFARFICYDTIHAAHSKPTFFQEKKGLI